MELPAALQRVRKIPLAHVGWLEDYYEASEAFTVYEKKSQAHKEKKEQAAHAEELAKGKGAKRSFCSAFCAEAYWGVCRGTDVF
jgi:hypothetical protein